MRTLRFCCQTDRLRSWLRMTFVDTYFIPLEPTYLPIPAVHHFDLKHSNHWLNPFATGVRSMPGDASGEPISRRLGA